MQNIKTNYLPGLNGLRSIAAIAVIISHVGIHLDSFGLTSKGGYALASFGVTIFFTLSGFLITYLLFLEKNKIGTVKVKKFYIRRLLRIWPLYFLYLLIVSFVNLNNANFSWNILYYIGMLPNIDFTLQALPIGYLAVPLLGHYWSLGVEEQFYAFWPWVVRKMKNIELFLLMFIIGFFLLKVVLSISNISEFLTVFFHYTRFGCMGIGALGAYYFVFKKDRLKIIYSKMFEIVAWGVIALIAFNSFHIFSIIDHEIASIATLVIIINQIDNPKRLISLENRMFDYLGKISFGLYVYNPLVIYLFYTYVDLPDFYLKTLSIYVLIIISVIFISHVSYFYFEKRFLTLKKKFTIIKSASNAKEAYR